MELILLGCAFVGGWYLRGKFGSVADVIAYVKSLFTSTTSGT